MNTQHSNRKFSNDLWAKHRTEEENTLVDKSVRFELLEAVMHASMSKLKGEAGKMLIFFFYRTWFYGHYGELIPISHALDGVYRKKDGSCVIAGLNMAKNTYKKYLKLLVQDGYVNTRVADDFYDITAVTLNHEKLLKEFRKDISRPSDKKVEESSIYEGVNEGFGGVNTESGGVTGCPQIDTINTIQKNPIHNSAASGDGTGLSPTEDKDMRFPEPKQNQRSRSTEPEDEVIAPSRRRRKKRTAPTSTKDAVHTVQYESRTRRRKHTAAGPCPYTRKALTKAWNGFIANYNQISGRGVAAAKATPKDVGYFIQATKTKYPLLQLDAVTDWRTVIGEIVERWDDLVVDIAAETDNMIETSASPNLRELGNLFHRFSRLVETRKISEARLNRSFEERASRREERNEENRRLQDEVDSLKKSKSEERHKYLQTIAIAQRAQDELKKVKRRSRKLRASELEDNDMGMPTWEEVSNAHH